MDPKVELHFKKSAILNKAKEAFVSKVYQHLLQDMVDDENIDPEDVIKELHFVSDSMKEKFMSYIEKGRTANEVEGKEWYMITINPDPAKVSCHFDGKNVKSNDFIYNFCQSLKLKTFNGHGIIWALDQRGDTDIHGLHIHMVYNRTAQDGKKVRPSAFVDTLWRKLSPYLGNKMHIKTKVINTTDDLQKCINYIRGVKTESKMAVASKTLEWLNSINCSPYFENDHFKKLQNTQNDKMEIDD